MDTVKLLFPKTVLYEGKVYASSGQVKAVPRLMRDRWIKRGAIDVDQAEKRKEEIEQNKKRAEAELGLANTPASDKKEEEDSNKNENPPEEKKVENTENLPEEKKVENTENLPEEKKVEVVTAKAKTETGTKKAADKEKIANPQVKKENGTSNKVNTTKA